MFLKVFISLVAGYILWSLLCFYNNYRKAASIGLPVRINPIDATNPLWFLSQKFLYPILIKLPFNLGETAVRLDASWTFRDRYQQHAKYGPAFIEVTPTTVRIFLADPAAVDDLSKRRNEFIKPPELYFALDVFGPNLDTVNGKTWERHRRITVPPFNEKNSALVWRESLEQCSQMMNGWLSKKTVSATQANIHAMALNVLCFAGFGVKANFIDERDQPATQTQNQKIRLGYREALRILLANFISLVFHDILVKSGYPSQFMWGGMKMLTDVKAEFKEYMQDLIAKERAEYEQGNFDRHNLVSTLIRADIEANKTLAEETDEKPGTILGKGQGLTNDEIYGNLFIYNLAGHDTTAGTIHFALILLALRPELQDWISQEINYVRASATDAQFFYEETFPKLKRCLALMYETVRLYGPVQTNPRRTQHTAITNLSISGSTYQIPPSTQVISNFSALHTNPEYWSPDPQAFRPSRFIGSSQNLNRSDSNSHESLIETESLSHPPIPGTFVPWNIGPRICPGRKFSQVEFVAAMFVLFNGNNRVQLAPLPAESQEQVRSRAANFVQSATVEVTLKLRGDIDLQWIQHPGR